MSTIVTTERPDTVELTLRFGGEYVTHHVSTKPARECTAAEIPLIDLANIDGDASERSKIADQVRAAATRLGFFYIKNHGIKDEVINKAYSQALA
jgi:hypothetical protein